MTMQKHEKTLRTLVKAKQTLAPRIKTQTELDQEERYRQWREEQKKEERERDEKLASLESSQAKIDCIVDHLTMGHGETIWPMPCRWFKGNFFWFEADWSEGGLSKRCSIERMTEKQMLAWYKRAKRCFDQSDLTFKESLYETAT